MSKIYLTPTASMSLCPGFGQDRVNFHKTPGRGTAGGVGADPTWPNRAWYSIPRDVTLGTGGGALVLSEREGLLCKCVSYFLLI